ncbi:hypothetical protein [Streptomyces sp. NBC_01462]|uniref:hypothetical protein n=1 Tax=Streptomyces sp. NBC_01462 TaxID=2903876 RepID=UPI002E338D5B|nr:hypothetical protein [Streptomyces sp. NBC_01462]
MSTLEAVHRAPYTNHTSAPPVHQQRSDGLAVAFSPPRLPTAESPERPRLIRGRERSRSGRPDMTLSNPNKHL